MGKKLQMCGTEAEMRDVAARICRDYLHGNWKTVSPQELEFSRISGGLSNFLYMVGLPDHCTTVTKLTSSVNLNSVQNGASDEDTPGELAEKKSPVSLLRQRSLLRSNSFNLEEPKKVLLRIYGQVHGERAMDAIITESVIFTLLSERKLGPKLHGVFSGGRIEQYIPARPLLTRELSEPALSMKIAEKTAAIHSMDLPLIKEPNWLWKTFGRWYKVMQERLETSKPKDENEERCIKKLKSIDMEKEINWLKEYLFSIDSPVVFCHNDLQEGNILLREDPPLQTLEEEERSDVAFDDSTNDSLAVHSDKENNHTTGVGRRTNGASYVNAVRVQFAEEDGNTTDSLASHLSDDGEPRLVLIDFEYCAYNHRGFDIANHFVEWMYDYTNPEYPFYDVRSEQYPTLEQKEIFMRQYLKHFNVLHHTGETEFPLPPTVDEVNKLNAEVEAFTLASHMLWTLWGVVNAGKSQIEFGYWDYAVSRAEWYLKVKQEIIKKENSGLPMKRKICEVDI